jgi:YbbR domain-containing protein
MISFLRRVFVDDFWLKLFSLLLAVLIWLTASLAIQKEGSPATPLALAPEERTFSNLPVLVISSAQDVRNFKVAPNTVEVTVRGDAKTVHALGTSEIRARVDLTGIETARELKARIEVSIPAGASLVRVEPAEVQVIFPPKP